MPKNSLTFLIVRGPRELAELESGGSRPRSGSLDGDREEVEGWRVDAVGQHFLEVEKYVNVNVTAVRKMLRKHDAVLPQWPVKKSNFAALLRRLAG